MGVPMSLSARIDAAAANGSVVPPPLQEAVDEDVATALRRRNIAMEVTGTGSHPRLRTRLNRMKSLKVTPQTLGESGLL